MNASAPASPAAGSPPSLAARLAKVRVSARQDLEVTRHLFRSRPAYIVRDPLTFQNHRFDPGDYELFVAITADRTLGEIFTHLVAQGKATPGDEAAFYQFIVSLHRLNFLNLPVSDEKLLYQRHQARQRARRREKMMGFLFLRVPLVNPDAFLDKTIRYARPVFSRWAFVAWLLLVGTAAFTAARNFGELINPVQGVLAARNLPLMWLTLVGLKVLHEFGHAYACKLYGGRVPEMGAYFIIFTPCAYVDATACWGFTKRHQRLVVCLAGMYIESVAAALAVFAWAFSGPGLLHDVAYNVVFLAGVVTVLFNINPLMRYDGYYVLSDLLEIPNLRQRASNQMAATLKRLFVGVKVPHVAANRRERLLLTTYGIAASVYRTMLVLAISAMLASKMFLVGMGVAGFYVGSTVVGLVRKLARYLWFAQETAPVRRRAIALSVILLGGIPTVVLLVPWRGRVQAAGVLAASQETVIRAPMAGFVAKTGVEPGDAAQPGELLVQLTSDALDETIASVSAAIEASDIRRYAYEVDEPSRAMEEAKQGTVYRADLDRWTQEQSARTVQAYAAGLVLDCLRPRDIGRFVAEGEPVATLAAGHWQVRALLTEEQVADAQPKPGDTVEVRVCADPSSVLTGVVQRVASAGSKTVPVEALTHLGGGDIAIDPLTGQAGQPYFEVTVDLDRPISPMGHGMSAQVRFHAGAHSLGTQAARRLIRFLNRLRQR